MGYSIRAQGDTVQTNIMEFMVDTREDLSTLGTKWAPGSVAICTEDTSVFMLSTENKWVKL